MENIKTAASVILNRIGCLSIDWRKANWFSFVQAHTQTYLNKKGIFIIIKKRIKVHIQIYLGLFWKGFLRKYYLVLLAVLFAFLIQQDSFTQRSSRWHIKAAMIVENITHFTVILQPMHDYHLELSKKRSRINDDSSQFGFIVAFLPMVMYIKFRHKLIVFHRARSSAG